jgi:hypothetical protein
LARIAEYHPDRNSTTHATAITALVNEAWAVIRDPERRREYDARTSTRGTTVTLKPAPKTTSATRSDLTRRSAPIPSKPRQPTAPDSNRRDSARLKTLITIWVTTPTREGRPLRATCTCVDLSTDGMAFALTSSLDAGTPLAVTLDLPDGSLDATATVVRCEPLKRPGRWKIALTFVGLPASARRRIREFVELEIHSRLG